MRRLLVTLLALGAFALPGQALAGGGSYLFDGGSPAQQAQVRAALEASSFDWGLVPGTVAIHLRPGSASRATPGHVWIDSNVLTAGRFAWAVVQDEYAHQLDFLRFDDAIRGRLLRELGGRDWCYGQLGLAHSDYGCERFSSMVVWAYWQSPDNAYRPRSGSDESAAMGPAAFRKLMAELLGVRMLQRKLRR
jgi:hypothetical protein